MKNIFISLDVYTKALVSIVLLVGAFSFVQSAAAQFTYDYGGSDYGYYSNSAFDYDYGGSDYGYYSNPNFTYDYGGSDYGYYSNSAFDYDYGGSDYGYYSNPSFTYDYGGSDYGVYDYYATNGTYGSSYVPVYNDYDYATPYNYNYNYGGSGYNYVPGYNTGYNYNRDYDYGYNYGGGSRPRGDEAGCRAFTADDYNVSEGDYVTLRWDTTEAEDADINNNVGDVPVDGDTRVRVYRDTTFVLTVRNDWSSDTCRLTIEVDEDEDDNDNDRDDVRCDAFTVSDDRVDEGDYVTLRWRTTDANDVDINHGIGDVAEDGERRVRVTDDITYTLTARDANDSDTCRVSIEVDEDDNDNDNDLRCRLTVSDSAIYAGQPVVLSWNNTAADRAVLKDDKGKEIFDTRDTSKYDEDADSIQVRPARSTDYTLTVYDGNRKRTCEVGVDIENVVTGTRFQGGIHLGQVPYTGFEAGPTLTFIFYVAVVLWGIVIAYVLVLRKRKEEDHGHEMVHSAAHTAHAEVHAPTDYQHAESFPSNLPVMEQVTPVTSESIEKHLEARAHDQFTLFSSDALNYVAGLGSTDEEKIAKLDDVIAKAKATFPKEGDWMVINKERVLKVLA